MLTELSFHIRPNNKLWQAKATKSDCPIIESPNKGDVVKKTIKAAQELANKAVVYIYGLDGRILEMRQCGNNRKISS